MKQIVTCSFFKISGFSKKWWAFKQMRIGLKRLEDVEGLTFYKILGSGSKNGFSAVPNFGVYVVFCVWENDDCAEQFFQNNSFYRSYLKKSDESFNAYAHAAEAHGTWDGKSPFESVTSLQLDGPVLVLTRARIRLSKLLSFWRRVGKVSHSLDQYDSVVFSIGVGEWPLIQQATLSIWKSQKEMIDYAYKNSKHKEVIKLTRKLNWYSEELFARFVPYKLSGNWNSKDVIDLLPNKDNEHEIL